MAAKINAAVTCNKIMLSYYYKPKSGSCYKDPRGSLSLGRSDIIESHEKHHVCKFRILIENAPRSTAMPEGTGTFAVWAHNRFLAYDRPKSDCNWGRQIQTSHRGSFLCNWNFVCYYC